MCDRNFSVGDLCFEHVQYLVEVTKKCNKAVINRING